MQLVATRIGVHRDHADAEAPQSIHLDPRLALKEESRSWNVMV